MKSITVFLIGILASTTVSAESNGIVFLDDLPNSKFPSCMENAMHQAEPQRKVVSASVFRDSLFPYFEIGTAPKTIEDLDILSKNSVVQRRIEGIGVRYVAVLVGNTSKPNFEGPMACGGGFGAAGCFGVSSREAQTQIDVAIWDLRLVHEPLIASGTAVSHDKMIGIVIPIPLSKNTNKPACREAVKHILEVIKAAPMQQNTLAPEIEKTTEMTH